MRLQNSFAQSGNPTFSFAQRQNQLKWRQKTIGTKNSPVIFNITYTPYRLKKNATETERKKHAKERAFYDMTGRNNIYRYMTSEKKQQRESAVGFTMLEYFQKSTGVFDENGMIGKEQLAEMKDRAKNNQGNFWHGYISFNERDSVRIDHVEKCFDLLKKTFPAFLQEAGFQRDDVDLMCALHIDKETHYHVHFCFWEKTPKVKNKRAAGYIYRKKGKIPYDVIEHMTERVNAFTLDDEIAKRRDEAIDKMKTTTRLGELRSKEKLFQKIKALAADLPKDKPLWYGSKEMQPYRERIDDVVDSLIFKNRDLFYADLRFKSEVFQKEQALREKMKSVYERAERRDRHDDERQRDSTKVKEIRCIERLRLDYRRRLGNIVLNKVRYVQTHTFTYDRTKKRKSNDKKLKRSLAISQRKVKNGLERFFLCFASMFMPEVQSRSNRLQQIEKELKYEYEKEQAKIAEEEAKRNTRLNAEQKTEYGITADKGGKE